MQLRHYLKANALRQSLDVSQQNLELVGRALLGLHLPEVLRQEVFVVL